MVNRLQAVITIVISVLMYRWIDDISVVGNVNLASVQIGQDVILSCEVKGCGSPNLQLHLYKWEGLANRSVYIHPSSSGEREKDGAQKGRYINGVLEVTLSQVKPADAGKYVCALKCKDVYKEDTMEVKLGGDINTSVGEDVLLPCPLIVAYGSSYLMQWRRLSPGKSQNIYSYLYQETCPLVYSEDSLGDRCSSNRSSSRIWFEKKYKPKLEVFKGNEFRNRNGYLKLKNIQEEDAGKYVCSVTSESLHKENIFRISVKGIQDQNTDISISDFLPYLLCLLVIMELCFAKRIVRLQRKLYHEFVRKERKLYNEFDHLPEEMCHGQRDQEELTKLHSEIDKLTEEKRQWQGDKEELTKLHSEVDKLTEEKDMLAEEKDKFTEEKRQWQRDSEILKVLSAEVEWRRACSHAENITLDEDSAHPNLFIATDKKRFNYETQPLPVFLNTQRFDGTVAVLANEGFSSGNHYWTVDISNSAEWDLGVARRSIQRKGQSSLSPKVGSWVLGRSGKDYWAKTDPWTRVHVQRKPSKIGVYLSFREEKVTFYNVDDMTVLFIFKNCLFDDEIVPFFKNTDKGTTIRICSIKEEKA